MVIDTSVSVVFDKRLYDFLENPVVAQINSKQATMDFIEYRDLKKATVDTDKYSAPIIFPFIEAKLGLSSYPHYKERVKEELILHKKEFIMMKYVVKYAKI